MVELVSKYQTKDQIKEFIRTTIDKYGEDVILIEITRKGYWIEKIIDIENDGELTQWMKKRNVTVYSDRYLMKCLSFREFRGRKVIILDDAGNNGILLFFYYALLLENGAEEVIPMVYALNTKYPYVDNSTQEEVEERRKREFYRTIRHKNLSEEESERLFKERSEGFERSLRWQIWMSPKDMGALTVAETIWFQKRALPMVVDLPMYRGCDGNAADLVLTKEQWEMLGEGSSVWQQIPIETELAGEALHYGYFQMQNDSIYSKFKTLFFNFIVRYKYEPIGDGSEIRFVFVPFAIINSCSLSDMVWNFFHLFEGSEYAQQVIDTINEENKKADRRTLPNNSYSDEDWEIVLPALKENHNMCRALYRAIIYDISSYIGYVFNEYVSERIGRTLEYDWEIMKENLEEKFIRSIRKKYKSMDSAAYLSKLMECRISEVISPRFVDKEAYVVRNFAAGENFEFYMTGLLRRKKKSHDIDMNKRMVTLESLLFEAKRRFVFRDAAHFRQMMTAYIVEMTENSQISNEIYVDDEAEIMYRGFRSGENCEILLRRGIEWFYPYVLAFYQKSETCYKKNYNKFAELLRKEFKENKYIGTLISEVAFDFYFEYFKSVADNPTQILNKQYLLDKDSCERQPGLKEFVREAYRRVAYWDI